MPTTASYRVNSPSAGVTYYAPQAYWVVPNAGTTVTANVHAYDSSGNLKVVSSMTAAVYCVTTGHNDGSFTASNVYGVSANNSVNLSEVNGSNVFRPAGYLASVSGVSYILISMTYTGSIYDQPPIAPANLAPAAGTTVNTLTPTFGGDFSDPTSGDTLAQYEIVVNDAANGGGSQVWDSGNVSANSTEISNARFSRVYAGTALTFGRTYSFKARVANNHGNFGPFSAWTNFSTVQGPNTPTNIHPTGLQTSLTPTFSFSYVSPVNNAAGSYRYIIKAASTGATVYDSGNVSSSAASGTTISATIPGGAGLAYGGSYTIDVSCIDNVSAPSPTGTAAFTIAALPVAAATSPISNATVNTTTPTFSWSYTDPNFTQAKFQVQIYNATTGALIKDTGLVTSSAHSYTLSGTTIAFGTSIRWHVQVTDSAGLVSVVSADAFALVNNTPTVALTAPTNLSTVTTNTPSITWTYTPSSGGYAQASVTITLMDSNSNVIGTYTQAGTGTSFSIPAGVLTNGRSYKVKVTATDTNSGVGTSGTNTFTVTYTPPADVQGQPLAAAKNWIKSPYLNTDGGSGIATDWTRSDVTTTGWSTLVQVDPNITQPVQLASGDGQVSGAQKLAAVTPTTGGKIRVTQQIDITVPGWTAGSTHLSAVAQGILQVVTGSPVIRVSFEFYNSSLVFLSSVAGTAQGDTGGQAVALAGCQNALIPANTRYVSVFLEINCPTSGDSGIAWFFDVQLEQAAANDANFIAGDLGTGYSFDGNGYSVRSFVSGGLPTAFANIGTDSDPVSAQGGTVTVTWDNSLADASFVAFLLERRRLDEQDDDTAWILLSTITSSSVGSYTDYTVGGGIGYQYSIRQQKVYTDGSTGVSANRAIAAGACNFSPSWYIVNAADVILSSLIINLRLNTVDISRNFTWKERAVYTDYLGRVGTARDAGPAAGYQFALIAYFNATFGDDVDATRQQLVAMQEMNTVWYVKSPSGIVAPCALGDVAFGYTDSWSDTMLQATLNFVMVDDSPDL